MSQPRHHDIVIIGGGTAGTTVAASLLRQRPQLDVAIIEPEDTHYYQPAFTLVGGGTYKLEDTARPQAQTLPKHATWIHQSVTALHPEQRLVTLTDTTQVHYNALVVAPGIELNWSAIDGLPQALGQGGVCSNYDPALARYTWRCVDRFRGGRALFTQPATPIKCAGAPQKIAYLAAHQWRKRQIEPSASIQFYSGMGALFSVPDFVPHLQNVAVNYGIGVHLTHNLIRVDGEKRIATFAVTDAEGHIQEVEEPYDLLHVTPPQRAPEFVRNSVLANEGGWLKVDPHSLQSPDYPEVFALGDASSLPTSKTAAAVRKQAPVAVKNLLAHLDGKALEARYDGYTSCPVVTAYGKVILAEFTYGAKVTPTLPLSPFRESRFYWVVKKHLLPPFYWRYMLKGKEGDIAHKPLR
ncbi:NAD(P)/FAD-dependent oxidoreductase [Marinimicrobium locisalis]|uniref:NAD(P)/FAD-dependent oxidoreductase n=1 Tax=Marinimicrobium locisalis TaxID=546022 RepID=UPI0032219750